MTTSLRLKDCVKVGKIIKTIFIPKDEIRTYFCLKIMGKIYLFLFE